jgi:hypothetical protein
MTVLTLSEPIPAEAKQAGVKYLVSITAVEKPIKLTDQAKAELQTSGMMDDKGKLKIKGVSPKMLKRMKLEAVDCPVLGAQVGFLQCYVCKNFFSRTMGKTYCKGEPF